MIQVDKGLYRGPAPTVLDYLAFKAAGIKTVLSLESGWREWLHGTIYQEDENDAAEGFVTRHIPISGLGLPPSEEQINKFLLTVKECLREGGVYFHCMRGKDRTGEMAAAWRVDVQGWDIASAISEWKQLGLNQVLYFYWPWIFAHIMRKWGLK